MDTIRRNPMGLVIIGVLVLIGLGALNGGLNWHWGRQQQELQGRQDRIDRALFDTLSARRQEKNYLLRQQDTAAYEQAVIKWESALDNLEEVTRDVPAGTTAVVAYRDAFRALCARNAAFAEFESELVPRGRDMENVLLDQKKAVEQERDRIVSLTGTWQVGVIVIGVLVSLMVLAALAFAMSLLKQSQREAERQRRQAEKMAQEAEKQRGQAEKMAQEAETQRAQADEHRRAAEQATASAQESAMDMALNLSSFFEVLTKVAAGDLSVKATADSKDEIIQKTAEIINRMIANLQENGEKLKKAQSELLAEQVYVRNRIDNMVEAVRKIAEGDLSATCEIAGRNDDLDRLASGINTTAQNLKTTMKHAEDARSTAEDGAMDLALNLSVCFDVLQKIANGNYEVKATVDSKNDLIIKLAETINNMALQLKQNHADLKSAQDRIVEEAAYLKQRIDNTLQTVSQVAAGKYDVTCELAGTGDELDRLAEGVNQTAAAVKKAMKAADDSRSVAEDTAMDLAINLSVCFEVLQKIAAGDLKARANVQSTNDLVLKLGSMINDTAERLERNQTDLNAAQERMMEEAAYLKERVADVKQVIEALAQGDFTKDATAIKQDEMGELANALNASLNNLNKMVSQVVKAALNIGSAAQEVLGASAQFEKNLKEEARQVTETSAAMTELSASVKEMESNTALVSERSQQSLKAAEEGGKSVTAIIQRFGQIHNTIENTSRQVLELGKKGKEIGKIVDVITQIAEQTSLLALNAAIEAARAGEQGRGFAVVADEVSQLADRVAKSAKEIEELIETMQEVTGGAVEGIQNSVDEMRQGTSMLDGIGGALRNIIASAGETDKLIEEVVSSIHEQSKVTTGVATSIEAIACISEEGASASSELLKEGNMLMGVANELQAMVGVLKTR